MSLNNSSSSSSSPLFYSADFILSSCVELNNFDSGLRCPICYDYYDTPMMLIHCSHNYCSVCIRRTLSFRSICPTCNKSATVNDLKFNRSLDFLTKSFQQFQKQFNLQANKYIQQYQNNVIVNNNNNIIIQDDDELDVISNPSPHNSKQERTIKDLIKSQSSSNKNQPDKVSCPICLLSVVTSAINSHLDTCLANPNNTVDTASETVSTATSQQQENIINNNNSNNNSIISRPSRLLPVAYNLMNDKQIRELLRKVNLPITGSRDDLIRRHREYLLLSTAALDAVNPPSEQDIIKTILKKEKEKSIITINKAHKQGDLFSAFTNLNQNNSNNHSNHNDKFKIAPNNHTKINNTIKQSIVKSSPNLSNQSQKRKHNEIEKSTEADTINLVEEIKLNKENSIIEEIFDLTESDNNNKNNTANQESDSVNIIKTENVNNNHNDTSSSAERKENNSTNHSNNDNNLSNNYNYNHNQNSHSSSRAALFAQLTAKLRAQQAERKKQKLEQKLKQDQIQQQQQEHTPTEIELKENNTEAQQKPSIEPLQLAIPILTSIDPNINNNNSISSSFGSPPLIHNSDWRAIWSIQHGKIFYWNQRTAVGQFHPPNQHLDQSKYPPIYQANDDST